MLSHHRDADILSTGVTDVNLPWCLNPSDRYENQHNNERQQNHFFHGFTPHTVILPKKSPTNAKPRFLIRDTRFQTSSPWHYSATEVQHGCFIFALLIKKSRYWFCVGAFPADPAHPVFMHQFGSFCADKSLRIWPKSSWTVQKRITQIGSTKIECNSCWSRGPLLYTDLDGGSTTITKEMVEWVGPIRL